MQWIDSKIRKLEFEQDVKEYGLKDGIIAIAFYFYLVLIMYLFGLVLFRTSLYRETLEAFPLNKDLFKDIFYIPIVLLMAAPVFLIVILRGQNLKSLGLKKDKLFKSIFLGILFSLPWVAPSIINAINNSLKLINLSSMLWVFLYFLIEIAFVEELCFRGYLQTRMQGMVKSKWGSILVVGLMFGLIHIPFQMLKADLSWVEFVQQDIFHLITTCIIHIYLVYLFTRDHNILATTVTHTLINFIPMIFIY